MPTENENWSESKMTFDEWLDEPEGFGFRFERLIEAIGETRYPGVKKWLKAAYEVGYEQAKNDFGPKGDEAL